MFFSNIDEGYLEGMLRGYRAGILTSADYANLCQCESIEGAPTSPTPPRAAAPRLAVLGLRRRHEDAPGEHRLRQLPAERGFSHLHHRPRREVHGQYLT